MTSIEKQLALLFTQIVWPSAMVRERACTGIATLLCDEQYGSATRDFLLKWLSAQTLESIAAIGLLPLVRARMDDATCVLPTVQQMLDALTKPSVLSWMLLNELMPDTIVSFEQALQHSAAPPVGFEPDQAFEKYVKNFLPPIYYFWATQIEQGGHSAFRRQWAYEWQLIVDRRNKQVSARLLDFWMRRTGDAHEYAIADTEMSEIYRSAYLRSIARSVALGTLTPDDARFFAAQTCPVDLELWHLQPLQRPAWWPRAEEPQGTFDTASNVVWQQVEALWQDQLISTSTAFGNEWMVAEASGTLHQGKTIYDLELYGMFQRCHGSETPELEEIVDWYKGGLAGENNFVSTRGPSLLHFAGEVKVQMVNDVVQRFADWTVVPAAGYTNVVTYPRWQAWRMQRQIWLPTACLGHGPISFGYHDHALVVRDGETMLGKWNDWNDRLSERRIEGVPPATGQHLLIPRRLVETFADATNSTFCWVCCLTTYYRERSYETYKTFADYRVFGATNIIRT